jgi:hypothetical protein
MGDYSKSIILSVNSNWQKSVGQGIFPNEAACSRLISAFLMEKSEAGLIGSNYLNFEGSERDS